MTNKTYRFAAVAAVLLALLVFATPVGATGDATPPSGIAEMNGQYYSTLQYAVDNATAGVQTTITVVDDIALTTKVTISANKIIILDLNGKTISTDHASNGKATCAIQIQSKGNLTVKDTVGGGKITSSYDDPDYDWGTEGFPGYATNTISNSGELTLESGTIESTTPKGGASYAVDNYAGSKLTVNGGKIFGAYDVAVRIFTSSNTAETHVTINGGEITGYRAIWIQLAGSATTTAPRVTLEITDGTLTSNDDTYHNAIYSGFFEHCFCRFFIYYITISYNRYFD